MTTALVRSWRVQLITGLALLALACGLGLWVLARGDTPFAVDSWWNTLTEAMGENPVLMGFALTMDRVGGTWIAVYLVPLGGALALVIARRPWPAAYFIAASAASAGGVQLLKHLFGRARPEDILITADYGSFPSGHTANAATIAVVAALLFPRVWVVIVGSVWVVLMAFSRTYLHAHWASDTLGGALLGAGVALIAAAAFSAVIATERPLPPGREAPVSVVQPPD
jgi:membrane-associated phospholipid phosphatase